MKIRRLKIAAMFVAVMCAMASTPARALCLIGSASFSPLTVSTGTYASPVAPGAQSLSFSITGTYLALLGDAVGGCEIAVAFNRSSLPASMSLTPGGTATMPYTLQSSASGGSTLLYTGGALPIPANAMYLNYPSPLIGLGNYTVTGTLWALAQPVDPQQAGSYQDNITVRVFSSSLAGILQGQVSSQAFTVTGQVAKSCTIGGLSHPSADTATIPISPGGQVNTATINRSYANALCNTPSNLQLTSQNGAVTTTASVAGLKNLINYSATANFGGATAALDTSANPAASGAESGPAAATSGGGAPSGTLSVSLTPQANTGSLVAGSYSDTLTISIIPQ